MEILARHCLSYPPPPPHKIRVKNPRPSPRYFSLSCVSFLSDSLYIFLSVSSPLSPVTFLSIFFLPLYPCNCFSDYFQGIRWCNVSDIICRILHNHVGKLSLGITRYPTASLYTRWTEYYRKSVLRLLKWTWNMCLSRNHTDLRYYMKRSVSLAYIWG